MTKQHYEMIARVLANRADHAMSDQERDGVALVTVDLATEFARVNPRFRRDLFLTASGFRGA